MSRLEKLYARIESLDPFSEERDAFATAILGGSVQLSFDGEGRVVLPEAILTQAGISATGIFVGKGETFEIWEPEAFRAHEAQANAPTFGANPMATARAANEFTATRQLSAHAVDRHGHRTALSALAGRPLHAVAGLARPEAFFDMLRQSGLPLASTTALPDHHDFEDWAHRPDLTWLCTEKDAVKLWPKQVQALSVPLLFEPEKKFWQAFDALVKARHRYH